MYAPAFFGMIVTVLLLLPLLPTLHGSQDEYLLVKSDRSESFFLPFSAANRGPDDPLVYTYDEPKSPSWILSIRNNLSYVPDESSKAIVRIEEPAPSEKYIEIAMYGGESRKYWVAVNMPEVGYGRLYANDLNGWSSDNPLVVAHGDTVGLTVSDGKRTVVDRFEIDGFAVGAIAVYGRDEVTSPANAYQGQMTFDIIFGSFEDSPIYLVPAAVMAGIGSLVVGLLIFKKRRPSE
ncbi:MAG: hypothetical protein ACREAZ_02775 [Nitrososphaera sp.]